MPSNTASDLPSRIALVHEWLSPQSFGGAEKVVQAIDQLLLNFGSQPELFALVDGESNRVGSWLFGRSIKTSFIQKLPFGISHVQNYLPLLPFAIEQFEFSEYPLVISSSHLVAKGVLTSPDQLHVSYVHTPVRYAWDQMHVYLKSASKTKPCLQPLIRWQLHKLRQWDQLSGARPDYLIANSRFTAKRISRYWGRKSEVIHPPVSVERFRWDKSRDDFYLCLCRLVPNKRVDLVVRAFNQLKLPLLIVGDGPERKYLERLAGPTIRFLGRQTSLQVEELMAHCKAFVYAGLEDFGIAPVEAMAAGAPVIAFGQGGLLDSVRCAARGDSSPTGVLFPDQTVSSLFAAVDWFEENKIWEKLPAEVIRQWAERFSKEVFDFYFEAALRKAWQRHRGSCDVKASGPGNVSQLL
ncbi:glycosyltransferase [Prochlorococcus sp. MIT 1307]|uniref:glycosyltransferase n=1 Tax=Prochlorococcus sp. MIT 1307 TaxID=3096219 RepID=UPI002A7496DE|nr:glycosyltransferase [Prochlorococcus sp. MIT 1307]